jgi:hypothetical protein
MSLGAAEVAQAAIQLYQKREEAGGNDASAREIIN